MDNKRAIEIIEHFTNLYEKFYCDNVLKEEKLVYGHDIIKGYNSNMNDLKEVKKQLRVILNKNNKDDRQ